MADSSGACPLVGCGAQLHMILLGSIPVDEFLTDDVIGVFNDCHTTSWHVECENGHTVMVPGGAEDRAPLPTAYELARRVPVIEPVVEP